MDMEGDGGGYRRGTQAPLGYEPEAKVLTPVCFQLALPGGLWNTGAVALG